MSESRSSPEIIRSLPPERICLEPSVRLVGSQTIRDAELDQFLEDEGVGRFDTDTDIQGERLIEIAGRLCYMSFSRKRPGGNSSYIDHIIGCGHGSVLEHQVFNFIISGVSRSLTHELVRHRAGMSFSQLSQRFVNMDSCRFVVPPLISNDDELFSIWSDCMDKCQSAYLEISEKLAVKLDSLGIKGTQARKMALECARSAMPNATETKIFVTANTRAILHFLALRGSIEADQEIRRVAVKMLEVLKVESPNVFSRAVLETTGSSGPFISMPRPLAY